MKVGDLVMVKDIPKSCEEREFGIVISFEPRHPLAAGRDPDSDVWNDAIVLWPTFGLSYHMKALLEVISESR